MQDQKSEKTQADSTEAASERIGYLARLLTKINSAIREPAGY